jgi:hypothetical protein
MPTQLPQISHAILSAIQLHTTSKPNTYTTARNHLSVATTANNIPHPKITSIPTKNGAKQSTSTSTHKPRIFPSSNKLSSVRNYSHYHWGSNLTFKNKRQKREHYYQVNHVAVEGPIVRTKWSHVQITFSEPDVNLTSFPHMDAMVITSHVDK